MSLLTEYLELQRSQGRGGGASSLADEAAASVVTSAAAARVLASQPPPSRSAMNRLVMNYLVTEGFKEAAEKFQVEADLPRPQGLEGDGMDGRIRIRDAIQDGRVADAVALVQTIHPELLDDDRRLFFLLRQQQLIELIREGRVEEAIRFASDQLAERAEEDEPAVLEELERTMALLAFEDPVASPFADLLSHSHRQKVGISLKLRMIVGVSSTCSFCFSLYTAVISKVYLNPVFLNRNTGLHDRCDLRFSPMNVAISSKSTSWRSA